MHEFTESHSFTELHLFTELHQLTESHSFTELHQIIKLHSFHWVASAQIVTFIHWGASVHNAIHSLRYIFSLSHIHFTEFHQFRESHQFTLSFTKVIGKFLRVSCFLFLYFIGMPFKVFFKQSRPRSGSSYIVGASWSQSTLFAYRNMIILLSDLPLVDLTSNFIVLCTNMKVYIYNYS